MEVSACILNGMTLPVLLEEDPKQYVPFVGVVALSFSHYCCRIYWDISNENGVFILEMNQ